MSSRRTLIVGDVHGCIDELNDLLAAARYQAGEDRLFFVGDLILKGPESLAVLGNYEREFLRDSAGDAESGLSPTGILLRKQMGDGFAEWRRWIASWPPYIETEDFILVHAGLCPDRLPAETNSDILTNIRTWDGIGINLNSTKDPAWYELYERDKLVVFGHWAERGLVVRPNAVGLDTGCVYGRKLSALLLPSRKVVQVDARKVYCQPNF
jgi:bis(5'-nucleosyl)-tetraphosphatase (symmetrical)